MLEKKKTKMKRRSMVLMLILVTTIVVGASTAYAAVTKTGETVRGWTYTFTGDYNSKTGAVSGSTKASFRKHDGCFSEAKAYVLNGKTYAHDKKDTNYASCSGNAGVNNKDIRVYHFTHSQEGTCSAGGHTIY